MSATYEHNGQHGGYTIHEAPTGWVVETWSCDSGSHTGTRWLVKYGALGLQRGTDLAARRNDIYTNGAMLYVKLSSYYIDPSEEIRLLDRGTLLF